MKNLKKLLFGVIGALLAIFCFNSEAMAITTLSSGFDVGVVISANISEININADVVIAENLNTMMQKNGMITAKHVPKAVVNQSLSIERTTLGYYSEKSLGLVQIQKMKSIPTNEMTVMIQKNRMDQKILPIFGVNTMVNVSAGSLGQEILRI